MKWTLWVSMVVMGCGEYAVADRGSGCVRVEGDELVAAIQVLGGENAPYVWVGCPEGVSSWDMFDKMLNEANVVITPGAGFGSAGEGYFRISAFNSLANVEEVCKRIAATFA